MSYIENFATQIRGAYVNQNQVRFTQLLTLHVQSPIVAQLLEELVYVRKSLSMMQPKKKKEN